MTKKEIEEKFSIKITIEREKKCWFIKGRDWSNYSSIDGKNGHRLIYSLCIGPLISGKEICHACDRKGCINPDHLFQGTHSENMRDAFNKGHYNFNKNKVRRKIITSYPIYSTLLND